ncbi:MAG: type IX secretion system membrane protein PorP/SprF [Flavobacteriales bacterium]|nr:type IX secretion system membrane protein PorP/SprF [Flavobacteriales bacterium]
MIRALSIVFLLIIVSACQAQQVPQYSHYIFNQFQLNPAVAGTGECLDLRFGFRNQWAGFDEGPKTQFGSVSTRVGRSKDGPKHAIGLKFETDQAARFSHSLVQLAYAYHFKLSRKMNASIGLFAGFNQFKVDLVGAQQVGPDLGTPDPILADQQSQNLLVPEVAPGFWMHNEQFFFGLSVKHLTGNTLLENGEAKLLQHVNLSTGYAYKVGAKSHFIPSLRVGYVSAAPLAIDVNGMFDFDRKLALGVGYRNGDALVALAKFNFLNFFTLGYAYDMTLSPMKNAATNTHEVILAISACPSKGGGGSVPCAAYD